MDTGPLLFFILNFCASQNFTGQGCTSLSAAYFVTIDGQKTLDQANHTYVDPRPEEVKRLVALGIIAAQQKIHIKLNKYMTLDTGIHKDMDRNETDITNTLSFHMEFK